MSKKAFSVLAAGILGLSAAALSLGQTQTTTTTVTQTPTTVTKTVQNPDGSYTIIEYPVGKETIVTLNPVAITGATGTATILRDDNGTSIKLNLTGVPADVTALNLYAVDQNGVVTLLGPVELSSGLGTLATTTPLSTFMLVASPEGSLIAYDPKTKIAFRSAVPTGFAVIPYASHGERKGAAVGERVSATTTPGTTEATAYKVPMLNIPGFRKGTDTHLKIVQLTESVSRFETNLAFQPASS